MIHPHLSDMRTSGGDPRDLTTQQLTAVRDHLNASLFAFAWTIFGFRDLTLDLHGQVCDLLGKWGSPGYKRLMVQIPRGSYKTSLCTIANSLWQACRNPDETIAIFNERVENSKKWLRAIREVMMASHLFQVIYRDLLPPGVAYDDTRSMPRWWKWNDEEIVLDRPTHGVPEATFTAMGVGTASTGGHWTRIIKDDLVSEEAKNSESVMQRVRDWFDSSLPLEKPPYKGNDLIVCTPWTHNDVYRYVLEKYDYKLYRRAALEPNADGDLQSLMPLKWTVDELIREQERDPFYFSSQMLCNPKAGREMSFDPSWPRYGKIIDTDHEPAFLIRAEHHDPTVGEATDLGVPAPRTVPLWSMAKALLVDPAAATQNRVERASSYCRTAMVVVGIDPWNRTYVLDIWAGRRDPTDEIDIMLRLAREWSLDRIGIEEVTFSAMYRSFLLRQASTNEQHITYVTLRPKQRDKDTRIRGLIPAFRGGLLYWNDNANIHHLRQEYADYPYGRTNDILDALAYASEVIRPPPLVGAGERFAPSTPLREGVDPLTGY